jgi:LysM repeat protein
MRFYAIGLLAILVLLTSTSCQGDDAAATATAPEPSPQPTAAIGVDFATVTPSGGAGTRPAIQVPATSAPPTETPTATPETYVVRAGDTLVGIAAARGVTLDDILVLNPDVRPELLLIGQEIKVPPRPVVEPTAAPAASAPISIEIGGLSTYASAIGGTWVLGEVINNGAQAVELVQVTMTLASTNGETLASQTVWVTPVTIQAPGRAPFGFLFADVSPAEVVAVAELAGGRLVSDLGNRYLDLAVAEAEVTIGRNPIRVSGFIENKGQFPAGQISIVTTFYDDQGSVTGFHELMLDEVIAPGESRPFTFITLPPGGRAASYAFAVQATVTQ